VTAAVFTVAFAAFTAAHMVADYWVQTNGQAMRKGLPGWTGRRACLAHVATYTLTLAAFLALAAWVLSVPVSPAWAAAGLAVSALTHYLADRRRPLAWLADRIGKGGFWRAGEGLSSGAAHLDQSWHWLWIFAAALITAGGAR
jgi:hypothetical protein